MPEFRQNLASKEWVILAPERRRRPSDNAKNVEIKEPLPSHRDDCPFCPGNENLTDSPVYTLPDNSHWQVRVVPNKFAALQSNLSTVRSYVGRFLTAEGFGIAEVIIESPRHNTHPALMSTGEVAHILRAYRQRQTELSKNDKINIVTIFRNHGRKAGTSLDHPHSQIIATPIVPPHERYPMEQAVLHYDKNGTCVYCDLLAEELMQKDRIIIESPGFAAFCPFAARSPFECRIYPKRHMASFVNIQDDEIVDLADVLRTLLAKLHIHLDNPDYNYIIRSAPVGDENTHHLHWYMVIIPKISTPAGFEIGSGIYINTVAPEISAQLLRDTMTSV